MSLAPTLALTPNLVGHIVAMRAEAEMSRVYTGRVVTGVSNDHPLRQLSATGNFPSHDVRTPELRLLDGDHPVALIPRGGPLPALMWLALGRVEPQPFGEIVGLDIGANGRIEVGPRLTSACVGWAKAMRVRSLVAGRNAARNPALNQSLEGRIDWSTFKQALVMTVAVSSPAFSVAVANLNGT